MTRHGNPVSWRWAFSLALLVVIAVGFSWRLTYLLRISLFVDEFLTMLAAQMIVQKGAPVMPSGIFYDTGLLFSYVVAAFIGSVGFSEAVARFPSILFGLLSVAVTFRLGRRFFSPVVALVASTLLAFSPEAVTWGARSRSYASLQFWAMVGIWAMAEGLTGQWRGRWRALFWLAMGAAALSHLAGVVLMLSSLAVVLPAKYLWIGFERRGKASVFRHLRSLWPDALLAVIVLGGMAALTAAGRPGWIITTVDPAPVAKNISLSTTPRLDWMGVLYMVGPILLRVQYLPWTILLLVNLVVLIRRAIARQLRRADAVQFYFQGVWLLTVLMLTVVSPWYIPRYVFPLIPLFFLLGSCEMACAVERLLGRVFVKRALGGSPWLAGIVVILIGGLLWAPLREVTTRQEYGYDLALRYVRDHWREGDAITTFVAPGSYIYLGQCDYFPVQLNISLLNTPVGPVERATGAKWIESVAQLDAALAGSSRMWYVIDTMRFSTRVHPEMQEAVLARFRPVFEVRNTWVFLYERESR